MTLPSKIDEDTYLRRCTCNPQITLRANLRLFSSLILAMTLVPLCIFGETQFRNRKSPLHPVGPLIVEAWRALLLPLAVDLGRQGILAGALPGGTSVVTLAKLEQYPRESQPSSFSVRTLPLCRAMRGAECARPVR